MSGYLEVKYPFKSNLGLNPFKSWKRQWCILRPSPTFSGGVLAVYCSEAGAAAGTIELPVGFVVRRAKSRTRPHAFAVFPTDEPRKPRVLLAASTVHDAQMWMEKIKVLINGSNIFESEGSIKDSFSVTVTATELSRRCGLSGTDSTVTVTASGVLVSHSQRPVLVHWNHISDASLNTDNCRNGTCILTVDSGFLHGAGSLQFTSPLATALAHALRHAVAARGPLARALSKSDTELSKSACSDPASEVRRSSWNSGPSEFSLDDLDLLMAKDPKSSSASGKLSRCAAAGHLPAPLPGAAHRAPVFDDSICDRRSVASVASVASGIYEEIPELFAGAAPPPPPPPPPPEDGVYCKMGRDRPLGALKLKGVEASIRLEEPTYESVAECVYATLRRPRRAQPTPPPPLPPRGNTPVCGAGGRAVPRTGSLGCLPPPPAPTAAAVQGARTLPRWDRSRHAFSAFRKRLKSDSRTVTSPKSETSKDKDVETKKKKFEFTPTRDIFKSFKVSRKLKNLKIASGALTKGETKSCEFLDDTEHVQTNRCSKSVECLEGNDDFHEYDAHLSIDFEEHSVAALTLPQEIVELIIKEHEMMNQICGKEAEGVYTPMSPAVPPTMEHHYIVMSPRTNMA